MKEFTYLNGVPIGDTPREIFPTILSLPSDLQYWGTDALIKFYVGSIEMLFEHTKEVDGKPKKKDLFLSRLNLEITDLLKAHKKGKVTHTGMISRIYNRILMSEKLSPLSGFGISNKFKDKLQGNPEYQSIRKKNK